jgi:hypothetical protein
MKSPAVRSIAGLARLKCLISLVYIFGVATIVAIFLTGQSAQATSYYWDTNGTAAGSGSATGVWDSGSSALWNNDSLISPSWQNLGSGQPGTGGILSLIQSGGVSGTQGFFRVQVAP